MAKKSIQIEEALHSEVVEFCKLNGVKLGDFCAAAIKNWLQLEKFGDAPFFVRPSVEKEDEKPVTVTLTSDTGYETTIKVEQSEMERAIEKKIYEEPIVVTHIPDTEEIPKPRKRRL